MVICHFCLTSMKNNCLGNDQWPSTISFSGVFPLNLSLNKGFAMCKAVTVFPQSDRVCTVNFKLYSRVQSIVFMHITGSSTDGRSAMLQQISKNIKDSLV